MGRKNTPIQVFEHIDMTAGEDECWPWTLSVGGLSAKMRSGERSAAGKARPYFQVQGKRWLVTRLVYTLVHGVELDSDTVIRHTCDNSICCNPKHLVPGSHEENMRDMVERDQHGLPSHAVRNIRRLLAKGEMTHEQIAELYGTSRSTVTKISNNVVHTHEKDYPDAEEDD
jgi:hypothetical protein